MIGAYEPQCGSQGLGVRKEENTGDIEQSTASMQQQSTTSMQQQSTMTGAHDDALAATKASHGTWDHTGTSASYAHQAPSALPAANLALKRPLLAAPSTKLRQGVGHRRMPPQKDVQRSSSAALKYAGYTLINTSTATHS